MGEMRTEYEILVGEPERKGPRHTWEDNIRTDLKKISWEGIKWLHLAQHREQWRAVMNTVMNHRVP
jgi:hypothetical protein